MIMRTELEQSFAHRGILSGGTLLLAVNDALALIDAARTNNHRILGVDSFVVKGSTVEPLLDHILDLSSAVIDHDTWTDAKNFIGSRSRSGYMFEVVI